MRLFVPKNTTACKDNREKGRWMNCWLVWRNSILSLLESQEINDAVVKASYLIANEIAMASKPLSEGELVKTCMLRHAGILCPEKHQAFANISLTINRSYRQDFWSFGRFWEFNWQLKNKVKSIFSVSLSSDKSMNIRNVAQLAIFILRSWWQFEEFVRSVWSWCKWWIPQQQLIFSPLKVHTQAHEWHPEISCHSGCDAWYLCTGES